MGGPETTGWKRQLIAPALIVALTLCAYLPVTRAGYIWDDDFHVTENPLLSSEHGLLFMWFKPYELPQYYPMTHTTFWVEYQLWQLRPLGYHIDNVLLHAANALLLGLLLQRLAVPAAWWVAALFAVHPVHVESVAWISERKNVLSAFFYLLAFLAYERFLASLPEKPSRWRWYGLALMTFLLALFSKTVTATLPGALLVTVWWKRGRLAWKDVAPTLPFFVFGLVMAAVTAHIEHVKLTGGQAEFNLSAAERILVAGRVVWFYAWKLLWPVNLSFVYRRWEVDPGRLWQFLFPAAALLAVVAAWLLRNHLGRGLLAGMLVFGGTLTPALGFVNVWPMRFSWAADHFQYLASIGVLLLIAAALFASIRHPRLRLGVMAGIVLVLAGMAFARVRAFESSETIWTDTLAKNPGAWLAHGQLARIARTRNDLTRASQLYEESLRRWPQASVHLEYGVMLLEAQEAGKARAQFEAAVRLEPANAAAHNLAGVCWAQEEQWESAMQAFGAAVAAQPNFADAHANLGRVMERLNRLEQAREHYLRALQAVPNHPGAAANLARLSGDTR